jgi:hypothetical protein
LGIQTLDHGSEKIQEWVWYLTTSFKNQRTIHITYFKIAYPSKKIASSLKIFKNPKLRIINKIEKLHNTRINLHKNIFYSLLKLYKPLWTWFMVGLMDDKWWHATKLKDSFRPQWRLAPVVFFQICEVGWLATNCQCLYVHVAIFFGVGGSNWLQRKYLFLDVAIIICVCS